MINQGSLFMPQNLLILGGTTEASSLAHLISKTEFNATKGGAALVNSNSQTLSDVATPGLEGVSSDPDDF